VLVYTVQWIINHAGQIAALPLSTCLEVMNWLMYQIQLGIYSIYDNLRFVLVMGGYLYPEPEDLIKEPYGKALLNTDYVQLIGGAVADFYKYPRKQESHGLSGPMNHHLIYPSTEQEREHAEPAPKKFYGRFPDIIIGQINQSLPYNSYIENLYNCIGPYGTGDNYTHNVDSNTWDEFQFGNALSFSARLIAQRLSNLPGINIPNFNLDADRGYGWKTWRAQNPQNIDTNNPIVVDYVDL